MNQDQIKQLNEAVEAVKTRKIENVYFVACGGSKADAPAASDNSGDSIYVMDQIKDENNSDESWLESIALSEAMKKLSEREKKIIALRFYRGKTQMEIADEIGISQAQVSRIEKGALERIKKQI